MIRIGIDPGVSTGFAAWDMTQKRLINVQTLKIHEAMRLVETHHNLGNLHSVTFEDARLRTWLGAKGREALQGAGSIKRDCSIWADFLGSLNIPYRAVKPGPGATKWNAEYFARVTGWTKRTSNHARDAAVLVYGT